MPISPEHIIERDGKKFILYAGVLNAAHQAGLKRITTKLVQIPGPENGHVAICYAEVETERGFFTGYGDASPENVNRMMVNATIRLAETRAKARALKDALNIGELLADDPTEDHTEAPAPARAPGVATNGAARVNADLRPRPAPVVHEPWPQDDAPHPADADGPSLPRRPDEPAPAYLGASGATPKQLQTIARMLRATGRTNPEGLAQFTRKQASDLITELVSAMGAER